MHQVPLLNLTKPGSLPTGKLKLGVLYKSPGKMLGNTLLEAVLRRYTHWINLLIKNKKKCQTTWKKPEKGYMHHAGITFEEN